MEEKRRGRILVCRLTGAADEGVCHSSGACDLVRENLTCWLQRAMVVLTSLLFVVCLAALGVCS
jgi:hypothetical protein